MLTDDQLCALFERAQLPKEAFRHREHLRAAFLFLRRHADFAEAGLRFRRALKNFAAAHGLPQLYSETLTTAYLALISERMGRGRYHSSEEFLEANADLLALRLPRQKE